LTDLLRKASSDASLVKVPLRTLRDAILVNATRHGETSREVRVLFELFDGVHALCVSLQSRGAQGPYESVERAMRLRLFLCVAGDTWKDAPGLRARALRRLRRFAVEEAEHERDTGTPSPETERSGSLADERNGEDRFFSPDRTSVVTTKNAASAPTRLPAPPRTSQVQSSSSANSSVSLSSSLFRRAPSAVHSAVDVKTWRSTYDELKKVPQSRMVPVLSVLLDALRDAESFEGGPPAGVGERPVRVRVRDPTLSSLGGVEHPEGSAGRIDEDPPLDFLSTPTRTFEGWHRFDAPDPTPFTGRASSPETTPDISEARGRSVAQTPSSTTSQIQRDAFDAVMNRLALDE